MPEASAYCRAERRSEDERPAKKVRFATVQEAAEEFLAAVQETRWASDEEIRPRDHAVCVPAPVPAPIPTDGGDFATRLDRLVLEIERGEYRRLKTEGSCADFGGRLSLRRRHETERKEVARKFEDLLLTTTP